MTSLYTSTEERFNAATHLLGLIMSVAALIGALQNAVESTSVKIFLSVVALVYLSSVLYHGVSDGQVKAIFRVLDHISIYLAIGGTSLSILLLVSNRQTTGSFVLIGILLIGAVVQKLFFFYETENISIHLYLLFTWTCMALFWDLFPMIPQPTIQWIALGLVSYIVGLGVMRERRIPHYHAWWHAFVLCGSFMHYKALVTFPH